MLDFGVQIQHDNPFLGPIVTERSFDFFLTIASEAERAGFGTFYLPDHFMLPKNNVLFDTWASLAAIAQATRRIKLASMVTPVPLYRPWELAKKIATVDHISKGRTIFVAGCGWHEKEFSAYNVPFEGLPERVDHMVEGVRLMARLWTQPGPVSYSGNYYKVNEAEFLPKPLQRPHPPVWFGGSSTSMLKAVAKCGQGWIPAELPADVMRSKIALLERLLNDEGRSLKEITLGHYSTCVVAGSAGEVNQLMARMNVKKTGVNVFGGKTEMLAGTPEEIAMQIELYINLGVTYFSLAFTPSDYLLDALRLYSEEVMPRLCDPPGLPANPVL